MADCRCVFSNKAAYNTWLPKIVYMSNVKNESIWSQAMDVAIDVYTLVGTGLISSDRELQDQLRSAAVSITSAIAEVQEKSDLEVRLRYIDISRSSCSSIKQTLLRAVRQGLLDPQRVDGVNARLDDIIAALDRQEPYAMAV